MTTKSLSNVAILTHENKVWSRKKKQRKEQVKEVLFDDTARREFLTGFHKRKLARKEAGKAKAIQKEKEQRLEERRERRKELAERAAQNAKEVERSYGGQYDSGDEDVSVSSGKPEPEDVQFENEEQLATVTVVDELDPNNLGPHMSAHLHRPSRSTPPPNPKPAKPTRPKHTVASKPKFRYETKAARKHEKMKQRARRGEKAKRASNHEGRR